MTDKFIQIDGHRDRKRDRDRQTERETDRQKERQTVTQAGRVTFGIPRWQAAHCCCWDEPTEIEKKSGYAAVYRRRLREVAM